MLTQELTPGPGAALPRQVRPVAVNQLLTAGALVGLVVTLAASGAVLDAVGGALVLVTLLALVRRSGRDAVAWRSASGLARDVAPRSFVALGLAAWAAPAVTTAWASGALWAWAGLLVLAVSAEPALQLAARFRPVRLANLPAVPSAPEGLFLGLWVALAWLGTGGLVLAVALGLAGIDAAVGGLAVAGGLAHVVLAGATAWRVAQVVRQRSAVARALAQLAPVLAIMHTGGTASASYQIPMWEPHVRDAGLPTIVVVRDPRALATIAKLTPAPVICANDEDPALLDVVMARSLRVGVFLRNDKLNRPYLAYRHMRHVFLNHGDSDKPANFNPMHKEFDRVFVCGEQGVERYHDNGVEIPRERFVLVGRPQIADIVRAERPVSEIDEPVVLYAPTWFGKHSYDNYTSLPVGTELVSGLLARGATVIFRPHPVSARIPEDKRHVVAVQELLRADRERTGRPHVTGRQAESGWSVADCINRADALVSDVSSVTSDFLQSGKPFALVAMTYPGEEFATRFSVARGGYVIERDLSNLDESLDRLLVSDPAREARDAVRRHTLGDFDGAEAHDAFVAAIRDLAAQDPPRGDAR